MSTTRQQIEEIFEAALAQPESERVDWVNFVCVDEPEIAATVLELLRAHEQADGILEEALPRPSLEPPTQEGRYIGPYRVLRELGRGGMGVVYLAVREDESFKRRVAVKLLRGSPDADELYQRFRAERHILASLSHSNISQLLDGGITDGRLPYLVMEYVEGVAITEYCDRNQLNLQARLRLFLSVCAAVQHAHKNLVLHRDLKPGNILVSDAGEVKLLDFGIAKLLNPALSGIDQPITRTSHRVLTPQYASPEQVSGVPLSTASDVYSLGVVLYELLCGFPPYTFTTRSPSELHEVICEREPPRPSAQLRAGADAETVASLRSSTLARLSRELRGDLDAIVSMASARGESPLRLGRAAGGRDQPLPRWQASRSAERQHVVSVSQGAAPASG
jgi:serine/threonine protein kinase